MRKLAVLLSLCLVLLALAGASAAETGAPVNKAFEHAAFTVKSPVEGETYYANETLTISIGPVHFISSTGTNGFVTCQTNNVIFQIEKDGVVKYHDFFPYTRRQYPQWFEYGYGREGETRSYSFTPPEAGTYTMKLGFDNTHEGYVKEITEANYVGSFSFNVVSPFVIEGSTLKQYVGKGGNVVVPENITVIGEYAFQQELSQVKSITLPAGLTEIQNCAFIDCQMLTSITIPKSVTKIGFGILQRSYSLEEIKVEEGNAAYKAEDGVLLTADGTTVCMYPSARKKLGYIVPATVTSIDHYAFAGSKLTSLTLPDSLEGLGGDALSGMTSLGSIKIPEKVQYIGELCFGNCTKLTKVTLQEGLKAIYWKAFSGCTSLESMFIPYSVTEIGEDVFNGCEKLAVSGYQNSTAEAYCKQHNIPFTLVEPPEITSLTLSQTSAELTRTAKQKKPTLQLEAVVEPAAAAARTLVWSSSNPSVAKVDNAGNITALKAGSVTITCQEDGGTAKATCKLKVTDLQPKSLKLNKKKATLKVGKTLKLKLTVKPADALDVAVKWSTSNKKVATVDQKGKIKAVGKGKCTITCTLKSNKKVKVTIKITVK